MVIHWDAQFFLSFYDVSSLKYVTLFDVYFYHYRHARRKIWLSFFCNIQNEIKYQLWSLDKNDILKKH